MDANNVLQFISNSQSRAYVKQLYSEPFTNYQSWADGWLNILRQDPWYTQTSDARRILLSQFSRAFDVLISEKFGKLVKGLDYGFGALPDYYNVDPAFLKTAKAYYESKYTANEADLMGIQRAVEYRDAREDNGLIPQQLITNVAYGVDVVGVAVIAGAVAVAAAPAVLGTSATVATGSATEAGTLAGSTGLLGDASITVSAFDVGGAATSVGAAGSSGAGALASLSSLLPSGYSAAEIASAATAVSAAASQAKNIGTQLGLIKPNAGDTPIAQTATPTAIQKQQSNPLPLLAIAGLFLIL